MPSLAFASKQLPRVWVSQVTGVYEKNKDDPKIQAAQVDGKFEHIGVVQCASGHFLIFVAPVSIQAWNVQSKINNIFKKSQLCLEKAVSLDVFHCALFGWDMPTSPEETFAHFNSATDLEAKKDALPALKQIPDAILKGWDSLLPSIVQTHLNIASIEDCKHEMQRYDFPCDNALLYVDDDLHERPCDSCSKHYVANWACHTCKKVWCIPCGAEAKTTVTNRELVHHAAKKLKQQPEIVQVSLDFWFPDENFTLEVFSKAHMPDERKLAYILHLLPDLGRFEEALADFYKTFVKLFRHCYTSERYVPHNCCLKLFSKFLGRQIKLKQLDADLKAEVESLRDGKQVSECRCGNLIFDEHELCSECRRPSKCRACKKGFNQVRTEPYPHVPDSHPLKKLLLSRKRQVDQMFYIMEGICPDCVSKPMSSWPKRPRR